jgi:hypothetical protein
MHSSRFTKVAQQADYIFFASVVAMVDCAHAEGSRDAAWVIAFRDEHPTCGYSVHMVVFDDDCDGGCAFLLGAYDMTREEAFADFGTRVASEGKRLPDPVRA